MGIIDERIKYAPFRERIVSAEQAAQLVRDGMIELRRYRDG